MAQLPRITLEMDGLGELKNLIENAEAQAAALLRTVERIESARLALQVKINQPTAGEE